MSDPHFRLCAEENRGVKDARGVKNKTGFSAGGTSLTDELAAIFHTDDTQMEQWARHDVNDARPMWNALSTQHFPSTSKRRIYMRYYLKFYSMFGGDAPPNDNDLFRMLVKEESAYLAQHPRTAVDLVGEQRSITKTDLLRHDAELKRHQTANEAKLRKATQTAEYADVDVAAIMERLPGRTRMEGTRTATGHYRWLRQAPGETVEVKIEKEELGKLVKSEPLRIVHEDSARRHMIVRGAMSFERGGGAPVQYFVEFWWKADKSRDFEALLLIADDAGAPGAFRAYATSLLSSPYGGQEGVDRARVALGASAPGAWDAPSPPVLGIRAPTRAPAIAKGKPDTIVTSPQDREDIDDASRGLKPKPPQPKAEPEPGKYRPAWREAKVKKNVDALYNREYGSKLSRDAGTREALEGMFGKSSTVTAVGRRQPYQQSRAGAAELGVVIRYLQDPAVRKVTLIPSKKGGRTPDIKLEYSDSQVLLCEVRAITGAKKGQRPTAGLVSEINKVARKEIRNNIKEKIMPPSELSQLEVELPDGSKGGTLDLVIIDPPEFDVVAATRGALADLAPELGKQRFEFFKKLRVSYSVKGATDAGLHRTTVTFERQVNGSYLLVQ